MGSHVIRETRTHLTTKARKEATQMKDRVCCSSRVEELDMDDNPHSLPSVSILN